MNKLRDIKSFAIVLASGSGTRFGSAQCPKHLIKIKNIPTIIWILNSLLNSGAFNKIVVVTKESNLLDTNEIISKYFDIKKLDLLSTTGGNERIESFFNGVSKIRDETEICADDIIALVDSNRPLTCVEQIIELNKLANKHGCSCPARTVVNGIAKIKSSEIIEVPHKEDYVEFVTPEFIKFKILEKSKEKSKIFKSLVEYSLNMSINPVYTNSSELDSKLTYPEDLSFLEALVNKHKVIGPKRKND